MKRIRYLSQVFGFIYLSMGVMGIILTTFIEMQDRHPSPYSQIQSIPRTTIIPYIISFGLILGGICLIFIAHRKEKLYNELILNNKVVIGQVDKVQYAKTRRNGISYGTISPYIVHFSYSFEGKEYHRMSRFIWEKPSVIEGDKIDVFINDKGKGVIVV